MKNIIILTEKNRNNKGLLVIENIEKIVITEVAKILNAIDLNSKHSCAISNYNLNAAKNLN